MYSVVLYILCSGKDQGVDLVRIQGCTKLTSLCSRHYTSTNNGIPLDAHCGGQCILTTLLNAILAQKIP